MATNSALFCTDCGTALTSAQRDRFAASAAVGKKKQRLSTAKLIGYSFVGLMLFSAIVRTMQPDGTTSSSESKSANTSSINDRETTMTQHERALENTRIIDFDWWKDAFDTIMKANFTIRNNGDLSVKDFEIRCEDSAPSGTRIDSNTRTIYEIIEPHTTRTFHAFDMGFIHSQATRTACAIKDLVVVEQK